MQPCIDQGEICARYWTHNRYPYIALRDSYGLSIVSILENKGTVL